MGMGSELIAKRHGITTKTLQDVYLTLDDKDADDAYTKIKDKLTDEEKKRLADEEKKLAPKICPRCNNKNPATALYCNCGFVLDHKEAAVMHDRDKDILGFMLKVINKSQQAKADIQQKIKEDPNIKEQFDKLIKGYLEK